MKVCGSIIVSTLVVVGLVAGPAGSSSFSPTAFAYRGTLTFEGEPVTGLVDLELRLYDQATDGDLVATTVVEEVDVVAGAFETLVDFGRSVDGRSCADPFWVEIHARSAGEGPFVALAPRQPLGNRTDCTVNGSLFLDNNLNAAGTVFGWNLQAWNSLASERDVEVGGGLHSGRVEVKVDGSATAATLLSTSTGGGGYIATKNQYGTEITRITTSSDAGSLSVRGSNGYDRLKLNGAQGILGAYSESGSTNVLLSSIAGTPDEGAVAVYNASSAAKAAMYCTNGVSYVSADNFVDYYEHPTRDGLLVVRHALMGSEAGVYHRGIANLVNGVGVIHVPEHFGRSLDLDTVSIQLTPHSLASRGVAVAEIHADRVVIGELAGGSGSYPVSFVIHGTRRECEGCGGVMSVAEARSRFGFSEGSSDPFAGSVLPADDDERPRDSQR